MKGLMAPEMFEGCYPIVTPEENKINTEHTIKYWKLGPKDKPSDEPDSTPEYWKDMAETSDLVVLFDSEDQGYFQSDGCQMEERYAKAHCKYCSMGKYIDQGEDAEQIAERIFNKLK
jgi:hypothetical protein